MVNFIHIIHSIKHSQTKQIAYSSQMNALPSFFFTFKRQKNKFFNRILTKSSFCFDVVLGQKKDAKGLKTKEIPYYVTAIFYSCSIFTSIQQKWYILLKSAENNYNSERTTM